MKIDCKREEKKRRTSNIEMIRNVEEKRIKEFPRNNGGRKMKLKATNKKKKILKEMQAGGEILKKKTRTKRKKRDGK